MGAVTVTCVVGHDPRSPAEDLIGVAPPAPGDLETPLPLPSGPATSTDQSDDQSTRRDEHPTESPQPTNLETTPDESTENSTLTTTIPTQPPALGRPLGRHQITYYYMVRDTTSKARNTPVYDHKCGVIAKVPYSFAKQLAMEGTGQLRDGRVLNTFGTCKCKRSPCFFVLPKHLRWGVGVKHRPLKPFRSVAVDPRRIPIGTKLYVAELDGLTMPGHAPWGGFVHDGCVLADDRGGNVQGAQIDFYTARWHAYKALFNRHRLSHVTVFNGGERCAGPFRSARKADRNSI